MFFEFGTMLGHLD